MWYLRLHTEVDIYLECNVAGNCCPLWKSFLWFCCKLNFSGVVKLNWTWNWDQKETFMFSSTHPVLQGRNLRPLLLVLRSAHTCRCTTLCVFMVTTCRHMFSSSFLDYISPSPLWLPVQTDNSICSFFLSLLEKQHWNLLQTYSFKQSSGKFFRFMLASSPLKADTTLSLLFITSLTRV